MNLEKGGSKIRDEGDNIIAGSFVTMAAKQGLGSITLHYLASKAGEAFEVKHRGLAGAAYGNQVYHDLKGMGANRAKCVQTLREILECCPPDDDDKKKVLPF